MVPSCIQKSFCFHQYCQWLVIYYENKPDSILSIDVNQRHISNLTFSAEVTITLFRISLRSTSRSKCYSKNIQLIIVAMELPNERQKERKENLFAPTKFKS